MAFLWSRLGSNQRPSACEADALPLSYETGRTRRNSSTPSALSINAQAAFQANRRADMQSCAVSHVSANVLQAPGDDLARGTRM